MRRNAFTLIEIMIVVVIIGIIGALVFPRLAGRQHQAKQWKARLQIRELQQGLEDYYDDNGYYPSQEEGLELLVNRDYFRGDRIPLDPWGNPYVYLQPGLHGEKYSILSLGKEGKSGGEGWKKDIGSWEVE